MNRDNKGRFVKKERWTEIHEDLMSGPGVSLIETLGSQKNTYTLGVKVIAYYDVNVLADSPEEALEKISGIDSYKLLTEEIPVDCREPTFSWMAHQDG